MRKFLWIALAAIATGAFAQSVGAQQYFVERPGDMEFTGRMIARPRQVNAMVNAGVTYREAQARRAEARALVTPIVLWHVPQTDEYIVQVPLGMSENLLSQRLMASGDFEYVEPDWRVFPVLTPNDPQYGSQWHLPKINAPAAWNHFTGNGTITIAITDTGVRTDHEDLVTQLVSGANSASGTAIPQTSGGLVEDINGHGSHCAGIAGATGNNAKGVSGINWNIRIMPVRVTNSTGGSSSITALTAGATWAADNGARVISTSYSGVSSASVQTTGNYIKYTRNGVYCWAAGNSNANLSTDHLDVTIVGASDQNDAKASFSNYGLGIDVFAPGVSIQSTYNGSSTSYTSLSGTSMACPLAAGLAGLITGANPALTAVEVETILYQTCLDLTAAPGGVGNDSYWGWGRIDALAALRRAYNTKAFAASTLTIINGNLLGGGVSQLGGSDDQYVTASYAPPTASPYPISMEVTANSTNNAPSRIDFIVESASTGSAIQQSTEMFDFTANQWVVVDSRPLTTVDQVFTITPANSTRFRQNGTGLMKARVSFFSMIRNGARSFQVRVDRAAFLTAAS